jgi:hypothetical protein
MIITFYFLKYYLHPFGFVCILNTFIFVFLLLHYDAKFRLDSNQYVKYSTLI